MIIIKSLLLIQIVNFISFSNYLGFVIPFTPIVVIKPSLPESKEKIIINHERIHIEQSHDYWIFGFPFVYTYYTIYGLIKYGNRSEAYYHNPFEIEAYENQEDFDYWMKRNTFDNSKYIGFYE